MRPRPFGRGEGPQAGRLYIEHLSVAIARSSSTAVHVRSTTSSVEGAVTRRFVEEQKTRSSVHSQPFARSLMPWAHSGTDQVRVPSSVPVRRCGALVVDVDHPSVRAFDQIDRGAEMHFRCGEPNRTSVDGFLLRRRLGQGGPRIVDDAMPIDAAHRLVLATKSPCTHSMYASRGQ
jgi:hypothetical protein